MNIKRLLRPQKKTEMDNNTTLKDVKGYLAENAAEGVICPACSGYVKIYTRPINYGMIDFLVRLYETHLTKGFNVYIHPSEVLKKIESSTHSRDYSMLRHWGLIAKQGEGWKITEKGRSFVKGESMVQKNAIIYNNKLITLSGPLVSIDTETPKHNFI